MYAGLHIGLFLEHLGRSASLFLGPMLWFLKYFRRKIKQKYQRFWRKTKLVLAKSVIITLVFEKKANFFAENGLKSQKIVIITSTPVVDDPFWFPIHAEKVISWANRCAEKVDDDNYFFVARQLNGPLKNGAETTANNGISWRLCRRMGADFMKRLRP
jgi:hypothetical protein